MLPVKHWLEEGLKDRPGVPAAFLRDWCPKGLALGLLALSYVKLASGSFNPFIYFQF